VFVDRRLPGVDSFELSGIIRIDQGSTESHPTIAGMVSTRGFESATLATIE